MLRNRTLVTLMLSLLVYPYSPANSDPLAAFRRGDYEAAVAVWRTEAEQGDAEAQLLLGRMYRMGRGVPEDPILAYVWISLAAEKNDTGALQELPMIVANLSLKDISSGDALIAAQREKEAPILRTRQIAVEKQARSETEALSKKKAEESVSQLSKRWLSTSVGQKCVSYGYKVDDPRFPECIEREAQIEALIRAQGAQTQAVLDSAETARRDAQLRGIAESMRSLRSSEDSKAVICETLGAQTICRPY